MHETLSGKIHVFGNNIDTDQIYPGQYLDLTDHAQMALLCLEGASETFQRDFEKGDLIVAGTNFGCGSSRENAAIALSAKGVGAIVAKSFARIFYRNAINLGLPLFVCPQADILARPGDVLHIDLKKSLAKNLTTGQEVHLQPVSEYAMRILDAGGIKPLMLKRDSQERPEPME